MRTSLDFLTFYRFSLEIQLEKPLQVESRDRAVLLRGALGETLRNLVCHDQRLECGDCLVRTQCPYGRLFRLLDPATKTEFPRPFVLVDPNPSAIGLSARERQVFELVLVGKAIVDLPALVAAIETLGDNGVGRDSVHFRLLSVNCLDSRGGVGAAVYNRTTRGIAGARLALHARELELPGDSQASRVQIHFLTPMRLSNMVRSDPPSFNPLVRSVIGRMVALTNLYCGHVSGSEPANVPDFKAVQRVSAQVQSVSHARTTGHRRDLQFLDGLTGSVVYDGPGLSFAMPFFRAGEALGIGKATAFGNGRIRVQVLEVNKDPPEPPTRFRIATFS